MEMELKRIIRDGVEINKLKCPACGVWADLDDDQFYGRVSVLCNCNKFHRTIDFSTFTIKGNFASNSTNKED